jgi:hypothetical protein
MSRISYLHVPHQLSACRAAAICMSRISYLHVEQQLSACPASAIYMSSSSIASADRVVPQQSDCTLRASLFIIRVCPSHFFTSSHKVVDNCSTSGVFKKNQLQLYRRLTSIFS